MRNNTFLIIDFGASLSHTHHHKSIKSFVNLLCSKGYKIIVALPKGSEIDKSFEGAECHKILFSYSHTINFSIKNPFTYINSFLNRLNIVMVKNNFVQNSIRKLIVDFIVNSSIKQIKRISNNQIKILFPTIDPLAIALSLKFESLKIPIDIYGRFTNTAETRGEFSEITNVRSFLNMSKNFNYVDFHSGFETDAYAAFLDQEIYQLSPFPDSKVFSTNKFKDELVVGFLGVAKEIKGINSAPHIISQVNSHTSALTWLVQYGNSEDPLLDKIRNHNVKFYFGRLSVQKLEELISYSSILCLPYDIEKYRFNASAMAYEAADFLKPVITLSGTAFASEVEKFGIGIVCRDIDDLIQRLRQITLQEVGKLRKNIPGYNDFRKNSNLKFLEI